MEKTFKHIITEGDLITHGELFEDDAVSGQEVELTTEDYTILGLELHTVTEEDIAIGGQYNGFGFVPGDQLERPLLPVDDGEALEDKSE